MFSRLTLDPANQTSTIFLIRLRKLFRHQIYKDLLQGNICTPSVAQSRPFDLWFPLFGPCFLVMTPKGQPLLLSWCQSAFDRRSLFRQRYCTVADCVRAPEIPRAASGSEREFRLFFGGLLHVPWCPLCFVWACEAHVLSTSPFCSGILL